MEKLKIDFENVKKCILCGNKKFHKYQKIRWHGNKMPFVICEQCGLEFMNPRPTRKWWDWYYVNKFWEEKAEICGWAEGSKRAKNPKERIQGSIITHLRKRAKKILDRLSGVGINKNSKILEIGPGFGETLNLIQKKYKCKVMAIEPSDMASKYFKKTYGIPRIAKSVESAKISDKVDVIIMSHVLENINDPLTTLKLVNDMLADDGIVYIDSVNFYYYPTENPFHLYIFNPETMEGLLNKAGFSMVKNFSALHPLKAKNPQDRYIGMIVKKDEKAKYTPDPIKVPELLKAREVGFSKRRPKKK